MKSIKIAVISLMALLTACEDDAPPELNLEGHWIVEHGFFENQCQVGATFTEELLVLTFYSLLDGACQPELFGIENNALPIQIDEKQDYLSENGALSADLALTVPARGVVGDVSLVETVEGLSGVITEASDPEDLLAPLLQPTYKLTRRSEQWLPLVKGKWGVACDELDGAPSTEGVCEFIDFTNASSGRIAILAEEPPLPDQSGSPRGAWENLTFAIRNVERAGDQEYTLDFVIIPDTAPSESLSGRLIATDDAIKLWLSFPVSDGAQAQTIELFPIED